MSINVSEVRVACKYQIAVVISSIKVVRSGVRNTEASIVYAGSSNSSFKDRLPILG